MSKTGSSNKTKNSYRPLLTITKFSTFVYILNTLIETVKSKNDQQDKINKKICMIEIDR